MKHWTKRLLGISLVLSIGCLGADILLPSPVPETIPWSVKVVDREGRLLRLFTTPKGYWRLPARLDAIDAAFIEQLLSCEDKRFWHHPGVDFLAMGRAFFQWLRHGRVVSGASTISMQTIRLLHPRPRHIPNKLVEMFQALRLERRLSKRQILELYLSLTPYGGNLQGLVAANYFYFNQSTQHITPSQAALLISLPQAPEARRPDRHRKAAIQARRKTLERLVQAGKINAETAAVAHNQPVPVKRCSAPFLAPQLARQCRQRQEPQILLRTTLDRSLQIAAEDLAESVQQKFEPGTTLALLVVDTATAQVLTHVGSGDFQRCQLDLTRAVRSPGSALKPFIYGMAFERGLLHPETRILDRPQRFGPYGPRNFDQQYHGWVTAAAALQQSLNLPAVQILEKISPQRVVARFNRLNIGLRHTGPPDMALALGGVGISLRDLTALYAALGNQGQYRPLQFTAGTTERNPVRLLETTAAGHVDDILRETLTAASFDNARRNHAEIRLKTGTSYGFRDAWALGYNHAYTVGVWVGRPDGGYGKGITGRSTAVPVFRQLWERLPRRSGLPRPAEPSAVPRIPFAELPPALQWFGDRKPDLYGDVKPAIYYPIDGSTVSVSNQRSGSQGLSLKVHGGRPPFHWFVNGALLENSRGAATVVYTPPQPEGVLNITVIDSQGAQDRVSVWLQ